MPNNKPQEFNYNKCLRCCMWTTRWIPVLFIVVLAGWSYYAYVVELCFTQIDDWFKRVIYLILYHFFLLIFLWAYYMTVQTNVSRPPAEFYLLETEIYQMATSSTELGAKSVLESKSRNLHLLTRTNSAGIRFCDKCKCIKPDRAHHCSVCQTCVLKMDHHCPWVNNCVGHSNYKFFIQFLGYATTYCVFVGITSFEYFVRFWVQLSSLQASRFHILFLFFVSIMFAISISSLFFYHIYLTAKNRTTLESFRAPIFLSTLKPDKNGFNVGRKENFKQVFGPSLLKAFLPINTSSLDGIVYPTSVKQSMTTSASIVASTSNQLHDGSSSAIDFNNDRSYYENELSSSATHNQSYPLTKSTD